MCLLFPLFFIHDFKLGQKGFAYVVEKDGSVMTISNAMDNFSSIAPFDFGRSLLSTDKGILRYRYGNQCLLSAHETLGLKKQFKKSGIKIDPEILTENVVKYLGYLGTFIIALNYLGITPVILNIIFIGMIIIVILTLFLSLKDFVPNIIAGIHLISIDKLKKGDQIKIGDISGKVSEISLTETTLVNNGNKIIIPNSTVMKEQIIIQTTLKPKTKKK